MSNIPSFAGALAAVPKRKNPLLVPSEDNPELFIGRVSKTRAKGRYQYVVFGHPLTAEEANEEGVEVIRKGSAGSTNRAVSEVHLAFGAHSTGATVAAE